MELSTSLSAALEESSTLLNQARSYLHSGREGSDYRESVEYSIGALFSLAHALHKVHGHLLGNPDRKYSNKGWSILDQFFADGLGSDPDSLAKVRRLLDLVANHTRPSWNLDKRAVGRTDAAIVVEATTSILNIAARVIGLDWERNAS
jgi:hypothetical protein